MNVLNTNELNPTQLSILKGLMSDISDCHEAIMDLEDELESVKTQLQEAEGLFNEYTEAEGLWVDPELEGIELLQFNFNKVDGLNSDLSDCEDLNSDLSDCEDLEMPQELTQTKRDMIEEFIQYQQKQFNSFIAKMNNLDERERRIDYAMSKLK